jgi:hypothetical protein
MRELAKQVCVDCAVIYLCRRTNKAGRSGEIMFCLVESTYNKGLAEVRGRTFPERPLYNNIKMASNRSVPYEPISCEIFKSSTKKNADFHYFTS